MPEVPDGVFELVRTICTLSGIKVVADTILLAATDLYRDKCPRCRGAGTTTCQLCKGSKTLRARPARLVQTASGANMLLHLPDALHECWYCGPYCKLDFDLNCQDINDQVDSIRIMENLSSAMSGRPTPFSFGPTAGTVPCTMCMGSRHMGRFTPNLGKVFGLEDDYWTQIGSTAGVRTSPRHPPSVAKPRRVQAYLEYPQRARVSDSAIWCPDHFVNPILVMPPDPDADPEAENNGPFDYMLPQLDLRKDDPRQPGTTKRTDAPVGARHSFP